jgi:hypothetical protein
MSVYKRGKVWWFKSTLDGEQLRETDWRATSTSRLNVRAASITAR